MGEFSLEDARRSVFSPYFGRLIITREDMHRILALEDYDRRLFENMARRLWDSGVQDFLNEDKLS